jgi:DNA-binding transcriptional LysR family regulator
MLARWRQDHPNVRLIVHELCDHETFTELVARRIDVALVPSFAPWPQIVMEPLYRERMVAAVPHDHKLASRDTLKWTDLHGETIYVQEWSQSHAMREFYASMMGMGLPLQSLPASRPSSAWSQPVFASHWRSRARQKSASRESCSGISTRLTHVSNFRWHGRLDPSAP